MNSDISLRPSYLTDDVSGGFSDQIGFVQPPRISMESQRFNVLDENGDKVMGESIDLSVILLWENDTRIYYGGAYDPDKPAPPACFSNDKITPDSLATEPQSEKCSNCPRAVRDQPGFTGRSLVAACKEEFKLACLVAGAPSGKVFQLVIKPLSRGPYIRYRQYLRQNHARPEQVITKLTYNANQFGFDFIGWASENHIKVVKEILKTDEPAMIVGGGPRLAALPAPKGAQHPLSPSDQFGHPPSSSDTKYGDSSPTIELEEPKQTSPTQFVDVKTGHVVDPPKRGRGRPPKERPAESAAPPIPATFEPAPMKGNGGGFGMEPAQSPSEELTKRLNEAFGR